MEKVKGKWKSILRINIKDIGYWLLLILLTLPHMKNSYLARNPTIEMAFDIMRAGSFGTIVLWYVIKRRPISIIVALTAAWRTFLVYSTAIHGGETWASVVGSFSILSIMLLYSIQQ